LCKYRSVISILKHCDTETWNMQAGNDFYIPLTLGEEKWTYFSYITASLFNWGCYYTGDWLKHAVCTVRISCVYYCSVRSVMLKYLEKTGELSFDKIFNQRLGTHAVFHLWLCHWQTVSCNSVQCSLYVYVSNSMQWISSCFSVSAKDITSRNSGVCNSCVYVKRDIKSWIGLAKHTFIHRKGIYSTGGVNLDPKKQIVNQLHPVACNLLFIVPVSGGMYRRLSWVDLGRW